MKTIKSFNLLSNSFKIAILIAFLGLFSFNVAGQTTYSSSPSSGTYTSTTSSDISCPTYTSYGQSILVMRVVISGNSATFRIKKYSGAFTSSGTFYLKQDDPCSSIIDQVSYYSGDSYAEITISLSHTSGTLYYCGMTKSTAGTRYHTNPISITASTVTLNAPTPTNPSYGASLSYSTSSINFQWNKNNSYGVAYYEVNLRDVTTNTILLDYQYAGDVSSYNYSGFTSGHSYRWVVRAVSQSNSSNTAQSSNSEILT